MVPRFPAVAVAALIFLLSACAVPAFAAGGPRDGAPDRVIVGFDNSADSGDRADALRDIHATSAHTLPALGQADAVTVADGTAAAAVAALDRTDGVAWAQVDKRVGATMSLPAGSLAKGPWQWGLSNIAQSILGLAGLPGVDGDFTAAWERTMGSQQVPIAVVDTGVDFSISDLSVNAVAGGHDFVSGDGDPSPAAADPGAPDETSHGTNVAGIAAASLGVNQSSGDITGAAPDAGIMALRALDATGSGWTSNVAAAFAWAGAHGARVVNASLSSQGPSPAIASAIAAYPNTLFVVAAGNGDSNGHGIDEDARSSSQRDYPCALDLPNVVCVAAVDNHGDLASFSNYGATSVDVGGPGVHILSYVVGGDVQYWSGTSMATPFVAAAAALAVARTPTVTAPQLRTAIIETARPLTALAGKTASGGMIDADALVARTAGLPYQVAPMAPTASTTPPAPPAPPASQLATQPDAPLTTAPEQTAPSQSPAARSPQLKLSKVSRSGSRLRVSGTIARAWKGTVTVAICVARHCTRAHARVTAGHFAAKLAVARGHRVKITVAAGAAHGYRALRITRSARS